MTEEHKLEWSELIDPQSHYYTSCSNPKWPIDDLLAKKARQSVVHNFDAVDHPMAKEIQDQESAPLPKVGRFF